MSPKRTTLLPGVDAELEFQEKSWQIQRASWVILIAIILLALGGVFGKGPLSAAILHTTDGVLSVDYERFTRYGTPTRLVVTLSETAIREGRIRIRISQSYLDHMRLNQISPQPEQEEADGDAIIYTFAAASPPVQVVFELQIEQIGSQSGSIGLVDGQALEITQFTYP